MKPVSPASMLLPLVLAACEEQPPRLVSITPDHAFVDGCSDVVIQGSNLGTTATATLGGTRFTIVPAAANERLPAHAQDIGFLYTGLIPPGPAVGFADLALDVDGVELTLPDAFFYEPCPDTFLVTSFQLPSTTMPDEEFPLTGCGLTDQVELVFVDLQCDEATRQPLTLDCSSAIGRLQIPKLPDGQYFARVEHPDGTVDTFSGPTIDAPGYSCAGRPVSIERPTPGTGPTK
ncbi:MAG: hypothetical protein KTR31_09310 [Myxococcales bacterium]|nr:hypothetical protein [Myxococcales bacterium]